MPDTPDRPDRRAARREASMNEIVDAAWDAVREHGLAALSMRDLGERVGMRAQSIYSYFASKNDIYDAMFAEGYRDFIDAMYRSRQTPSGDDPVASAKASARLYVEFCTADATRYQLLFQRTIPGFEPSAESYAVAVEAYELFRQQLVHVGIDQQDSLDLVTAMVTGLVSQQISNDPGGDRWKRLTDRAVDMLFADALAHQPSKPNR